MEYNPANILFGIILLFSVSYIFIGLYTFFYIKYVSKSGDLKKANLFLSLAIVSLAWIAATFISVLAASSAGVSIFAIVSLLVIFGLNYLFCEKLLGISGKHKLLYSLTLGIIFNPAWLSFLGVL